MLLCVLVASACRTETTEATIATDTTTAVPDTVVTAATADDPTHPASPGGERIIPEATAGSTVVVMVHDGRIVLPTQAIPPGPAVVTVTNQGASTHDLHIEGPGVAVAGEPLPPGVSRPINVNFQSGTYTLYCPILDHRQKGEQATLTIDR